MFCCCCISTKCIEICILIFTLFELLSSGYGCSFIFKGHISQLPAILWVVLFGIPLFEFINIICILCWRRKMTVNFSKNSCSICFGRLGMLFAFASMVICFFATVYTQNDIYLQIHPCDKMEFKPIDAEATGTERLRRNIEFFDNISSYLTDLFNGGITEEERKIICEKIRDSNYKRDGFEYERIALYSCEAVYMFFAIWLFIYWCADKCRLRTRSDFADGDQERINENNMNNNRNYIENKPQYDIYGRPVYNVNTQMQNMRGSESARRFGEEYPPNSANYPNAGLDNRRQDLNNNQDILVLGNKKLEEMNSNYGKYNVSKPYSGESQRGLIPSSQYRTPTGGNFSVTKVNGVDVYSSNPSPEIGNVGIRDRISNVPNIRINPSNLDLGYQGAQALGVRQGV